MNVETMNGAMVLNPNISAGYIAVLTQYCHDQLSFLSGNGNYIAEHHLSVRLTQINILSGNCNTDHL